MIIYKVMYKAEIWEGKSVHILQSGRRPYIDPSTAFGSQQADKYSEIVHIVFLQIQD